MTGPADVRDPQGWRPTVVRDPEGWRQLAHPTRRRLLMELQKCEAARVADLAAATHEPANRVSFHLRTLAKHGFAEQVPAPSGDGRESWWRTTNPAGFRTSLEDLDGPDARGAVEEVAASIEAQAHAFVSAWFLASARDDEPELGPMNLDARLDLTVAERAELGAELMELFARWHERTASTAPRRGASTYAIQAFGAALAALDAEGHDERGAQEF